MSPAEWAGFLRGLLARGVVHRVDDAGGVPTADVETHDGVLRSGVEVLMPYGLAARPAGAGLTVVLAIGGDSSDAVALPLAGGARFAVEEGESALYTDEGTRVHLRGGGLVEVRAATEVAVQVGDKRLRVTPAGVFVEGDLHVEGNVLATGTVNDGAGNVRS